MGLTPYQWLTLIGSSLGAIAIVGLFIGLYLQYRQEKRYE